VSRVGKTIPLIAFLGFVLSVSALGTHLSFVRSVKMDSWSDVQLETMRISGNQHCLDYLKGHGISSSSTSTSSSDTSGECSTIQERYDCAPALLYQQVLKARREGRPEPTELPEYIPSKDRRTKLKDRNGFGSQPSLTEPTKEQKGPPVVALERAMATIWKNLTNRSKQ
jgi:hypothetical protein